MAQLETWIRQDLKKPLQVQYLSGTMFSQDNAANLVGVEVFDDGEPATLGGSVSGNVVRSDGQTVAVSTGTLSGNKVSVILPQAAYAIPGAISIIIKLTTGGTVTTLGAIVVTVYRSSTDAVIDPGTIIPSVQNLISQIETAVASIPADYSSLWTSLAPAFSNSTAYTAGQYVTYNGHLYRFTADHAAGSFVNTDCTQVDVGSELSSLKSAIVLSGIETKITDDTYFIQGAPSVPTSANRCTTGLIKCFPGDVIKITGNASGQKYAIGSSAGLDTGWRTTDFEYHVTTEADYYVNVATTAGNTPIAPSDITTLKVTINGVVNVRESLMDDYPVEIEKGSIVGGTPGNSNYYCRSKNFGTALKGALLKITNNTEFVLSNLSLYLYSDRTTDSYVTAYSISGSGIGIGDTFNYRMPASGYFKIRVSKPGASATMTDSDVSALNTCFFYEASYLDERVVNSAETISALGETIVDNTAKVSSLWDRTQGDVQFRLEIGSISGGTPSTATNYVRNERFIHANVGDKFTIKPIGFTVNGGAIYKYKAPITESYDKNVAIRTTASGGVFEYTFNEECYFKIRAAKNDYEILTDADVIAFESAITFNHLFGQSDFEPVVENSVALPLDYDTIHSGMNGKINIALQTDTHMSLFDCYKYDGNIYPKSDFSAFASILKSIDKIKPDVFINLGDIVRGYEFDPDYETRASIDRIISYYAKYISSPQMYLIGNHDDGNMWYFGTRYNQKQNVENVLYPNEQFNRITKFGENNGKNQNYFYRDIGGIRFIVLWQRDFDYAQSIPENNDFAIGVDQIAWLSGTALNTSLPVVVLTHAPLISSLYEHGGTGFADTVNALKAFENGGGTVIAVLSGHTHAQNSAQADGINHIVFANGYTWFELISIDLTNRTITCKAINRTLADITYSF